MIGVPYRYRGTSPDGFDCSGLVVYSYAQAGHRGLPRTASALERRARPIAVSELRPGDLLFFHLEGKKASHVAIYVGGRSFVHAPSSGKRVERVSFDHVYWGPRLDRAGPTAPIASSRHTRSASMPPARPGTASSTGLGASRPSGSAIVPTTVIRFDLCY